MLVNVLIVFAVIGALNVLAGLIRAIGIKRISLEFHEQPPALRNFRRHIGQHEDAPKQLKE